MNDCISGGVVALTTVWKRYSFTFPSISSGDAGCGRGFQLLENSAPNAVFYVWGPQVETSASPGPYIATNNTAASGSGGIASLSTSALPTGSDLIVAAYSGDSKDFASTSIPMTQTVNQTSSTVALASSANPSTFGSPVTFTATLPSGATGMVTFKDGASVLGSGTISGSSATFTTSALSVSSHSITAVYGGDSNYTGSSSPLLSQTVNKGTAAISGTSTLNPSAFGDSVTFNFMLTGVNGVTPSGSVALTNNGLPLSTIALDATGKGSYTISTLNAASHQIKATYGGDSNYQ
jgi:hypothetical protein